ncbi:MAG: histidine phosphatase family protein [Coprococcus sp.]
MQIELWMIRHGATPGNACGRYVGRTDEPLSPDGLETLIKRKNSGFYPKLTAVCVSPMRRCLETADILFPGALQYVIEGMQECDFGDFEYQNYEELNGRQEYQDWIDSGGVIGFPGGENLTQFCGRVTEAFERMVDQIIRGEIPCRDQMALICHGGTIMSVLDAYATPHRDYFEWQVRNGGGYVVLLDLDRWMTGEHFLYVRSKEDA